MCGITGILSINNTPVSINVLEAMNTSIAHRGPDGDGYWVNEECSIGFGHRRLSILDLSERGKQPMSYANGRYHITYNGEIFNFIELRATLSKHGYSFNSDTDTEVLLASYDFWGKECLHQFNGMWAFAIWDEMNQELFLARDHFGIKPLYYHYQPGERFVFGSETLQFKYLERFNRSFNYNQLHSCLMDPHSLEGAGLTIYSGIQSLLPGHYMVVSKGAIKLNHWWSTFSYYIDVPNTYKDQVEYFRALFFDSCKLRMRSDVSMASALSGGLDSSSVYSTLHYLYKNTKDFSQIRVPAEWQKAFVAIFPGTAQDETKYAQSVIRHINGNGIFWEQSKSDLVDDLVKYTKRFDSIYSTPIHVVAKVYEQMRQSNIIVSMDGHGVDEMMYGYPGLQLEAAKYAHQNGDLEYAIDLINIYVNLAPQFDHSYLREKAIKKVFGSLEIQDVDRIPQWKILASHLKRKLFPQKKWLSNKDNESINSSFNFKINDIPSENLLYKQFHYSPLPTILRNFDKASMMSGVEIRMPFMDHRLVSYVFKLPQKSKLSNGFTKRILRDAMIDILPENVRARTTKIGFSAPIAEWFEGPLKEFVFDIVNSHSFIHSNFWNGRIIKQDVEHHYKYSKKIDISLLWNLINAHLISDNSFE